MCPGLVRSAGRSLWLGVGVGAGEGLGGGGDKGDRDGSPEKVMSELTLEG